MSQLAMMYDNMWAVTNPLAESVHSTTVETYLESIQPCCSYSFSHINRCLLAGMHGQTNELVQRDTSETVLGQ